MLSQGEHVDRVLIARALASSPIPLLLDELATGLGVAASEPLLQTIDQLRTGHPSTAFVIITHGRQRLPGEPRVSSRASRTDPSK